MREGVRVVLHGALWTDGRICRWGATTSPAKMGKGCCDEGAEAAAAAGGTSNDSVACRIGTGEKERMDGEVGV